jgi:hypothetical protein
MHMSRVDVPSEGNIAPWRLLFYQAQSLGVHTAISIAKKLDAQKSCFLDRVCSKFGNDNNITNFQVKFKKMLVRQKYESRYNTTILQRRNTDIQLRLFMKC